MGTIVCILALLLAGHGLGLIIKMRMFCLLIKRVETKYIKKIDGIVVDVDTYVKDGKLLMRPSVEFTLEGRVKNAVGLSIPILLWRIHTIFILPERFSYR